MLRTTLGSKGYDIASLAIYHSFSRPSANSYTPRVNQSQSFASNWGGAAFRRAPQLCPALYSWRDMAADGYNRAPAATTASMLTQNLLGASSPPLAHPQATRSHACFPRQFRGHTRGFSPDLVEKWHRPAMTHSWLNHSSQV
jgi:hypothetical protein